MFKPHRRFSVYVLSSILLIAAPACATGTYYGGQRRAVRNDERVAYQNGFERGVRNGEHDARDRRDFSYARDREYRDADWGYRRGAIDRDDYRRAFRDGFQAGYTEAFNRAARNYPRAIAPQPIRPGIVRRSPAVEIGYRDGLEAGREDARDRRRYDAIHPKRYREGDHDYDSRYGSREEYKREYRAAFQQGYEEGYRSARR